MADLMFYWIKLATLFAKSYQSSSLQRRIAMLLQNLLMASDPDYSERFNWFLPI